MGKGRESKRERERVQKGENNWKSVCYLVG